ncbi:MAG: caspase family protein [Labilithrix sp.]|nr:caspase family protein [Labilithrix sp.]
MPKGISLHIGLNSVSAAHYSGWSGELNACEADANDLCEIARSFEYKTKKLLTKDATRTAVRKAFTQAAATLDRGDIFFLTYSGHGGQLPDRNGDEPDGIDETWCLYDGQLVDDEIFKLLGEFKKGVRIYALSDSCHSGTVLKDAKAVDGRTEGKRYRAMPVEIAMRTYRDNQSTYDKVLTDKSLAQAEGKVVATALLMSGCQDNQLSSDGPFNGLFTSTLLRVWNNRAFAGSYVDFYRSIVRKMPADQTPNLFRVGQIDRAFESSRPFEI